MNSYATNGFLKNPIEFGKSFKSFVEINFIEMPEAVETVQRGEEQRRYAAALVRPDFRTAYQGGNARFFDEVQECPEIVTAIKFLVDEGSYRYILSGSLLGGVGKTCVRSRSDILVSRICTRSISRSSFHAVGISDAVIGSLREAWKRREAVNEFVHGKIMELFRLYLIVGGMPAAVSRYIESNNLQEVMAVQQDIIRLYKRDIARYDPGNKLYIEEIFNLIPPENECQKQTLHSEEAERTCEVRSGRKQFSVADQRRNGVAGL